MFDRRRTGATGPHQPQPQPGAARHRRPARAGGGPCWRADPAGASNVAATCSSCWATRRRRATGRPPGRVSAGCAGDLRRLLHGDALGTGARQPHPRQPMSFRRSVPTPMCCSPSRRPFARRWSCRPDRLRQQRVYRGGRSRWPGSGSTARRSGRRGQQYQVGADRATSSRSPTRFTCSRTATRRATARATTGEGPRSSSAVGRDARSSDEDLGGARRRDSEMISLTSSWPRRSARSTSARWRSSRNEYEQAGLKIEDLAFNDDYFYEDRDLREAARDGRVGRQRAPRDPAVHVPR